MKLLGREKLCLKYLIIMFPAVSLIDVIVTLIFQTEIYLKLY